MTCADHSSWGLNLNHLTTTGVAGANDERMAHLMRAMNRLLDRHPQSRRRHLAWHTPAIVPVWPQVPPDTVLCLVCFFAGLQAQPLRLQLFCVCSGTSCNTASGYTTMLNLYAVQRRCRPCHHRCGWWRRSPAT